ncbi:MAG: M23 family metallopeptidase [Candidatus Levybacteria bacterium]|nr:M23 family metallopeptidase [Candidatus Levybacteria bacterium]
MRIVSIALLASLLYSSSPYIISAQEPILSNSAEEPSQYDSPQIDYSNYSATDAAINSLTRPEQQSSASFKESSFIRRLKKRDFRASEKVSVVVENAFAKNISVKVFYADGQQIPVEVVEASDTNPAILQLSLPFSAKPGRYRVKIIDSSTGQESIQNFTWGVLAINPNKSIYLPSETAKLSLAVLDEVGMMVCDADVELEITDPAGAKELLTTKDGQIKVNNECSTKDFIAVPDYEANYLTGGAGVYQMNLSAMTKNGTHAITDTFEVRDNVEFDVERISATRIYPPVDYPMQININANQDFSGVVSEVVPSDFEINPLKGAISYESVDTKQLGSSTKSVLGAQVFNIRLPFKEDYPITQGFGALDRDPLLKEKYQQNGVIGHDGVDFDLPKGTTVLAADSGEIVRARENYDYGTTIVIQHDWGKSYYGHLSKLSVKEGQKIVKGEPIGLSGDTGLSTAPHLHFGIKPNVNDPDNGYFGKINPLPSLGVDSKNESYPETVSRDVLGASTDGSYKVISWKVSVKKGENITLGYTFKAPPVSPQFYLLGPLEFEEESRVVFKEARQWQIAADVVNPDGRLYYGDATNTGVVKFQTNTYDFTFNGEVSTGVATTASHIAYIVAKANPAGDETMMGHLKVDGRLDMIRCTGACDAAGDFDTTNDQSVTSNNAMSCGTTGTDCTRTFDVVYESLSGRAMIVYAGDTADGGSVPDSQKLYYCIWNGTAWSPVSTCAPTNGSNDITLTSNGRPTFVTLKRQSGSNQILLGVSVDVAGTHEAEAFIWNGSSWGNSVVATDTTNLTALTLEEGNSIDVEWGETSGDAFIIYGTAATVEVKYKRFTGGSWGSEADAFDSAAAGGDAIGMNADRDPESDRIAVVTNDDNNDLSAAVWKADGTTAGWTSLSASVNEATLENIALGPPYTDIVWENSGSQAIIVARNAANSDGAEYSRISCTGSGCTATGIAAVTSASGADDGSFVRLVSSSNSDDIMFLIGDTDRILTAQHWNGSAWEAADAGILEADVSGASGGDQGTCGATVCPNNLPATFVYIPYSPWGRNWRWTDDLTTNDPTTWLANEDVAPTDFSPSGATVRLRYNFAELSGMAETNTRKKLQFVDSVTCSDPDSCASSNWTDVGAQGSGAAWRYADCDSSDATQDDDDSIGSQKLTGSTQNGTFVENGTAASVSDHNALATIEYDYCLETNGATGSTTYYFRASDLEQGTIYRDQRSGSGANTCGPSSNQACTYPSIQTGVSGPTLGQTMRHGKWFSNGVEQPFTF